VGFRIGNEEVIHDGVTENRVEEIKQDGQDIQDRKE
jgi:hypothetical protein